MKNKTEDLIIGKGKVGNALSTIFKKAIIVDKKISEEITQKNIRCMHICFPYSEKFEEYVYTYNKTFKPEYIIIHSTVKVGTTNSLIEKTKNKKIVHSPVIGNEDNLTNSLLTFNKIIGTNDLNYFIELRKILKPLQCIFIENPKTTELGKLLLTFQYGKQILIAQECKDICDSFNISFEEAIMMMGIIYNKGYDKIKKITESGFDYHKPVLYPDIKKGFGGTCIHPNAVFLNEQLKDKKLKEYTKKIIKIGQKKL